MVSSVCGWRETSDTRGAAAPEWARGSAASGADPSFFFLAKKFCRGPAQAGANESESEKCSGSWLSGGRFCPPHLLPAFTSAFGDWPVGSRIQLQQRNCFRISRNSFKDDSLNLDSQRSTAAQARAAKSGGKPEIIYSKAWVSSCRLLFQPLFQLSRCLCNAPIRWQREDRLTVGAIRLTCILGTVGGG